MHRYVLAIALAVPMSCGALAGGNPDKETILLVVDQFRSAILEKDKQAFLGLFLHKNVTWQSVMSDQRHEREKLADPAVEKSPYEPGKTPETFIDDIVDSSADIEETFEDVLIDTDASVASVAFNFKFLRNKHVINVGREYWLLVKTDAGWKIASVVWSRNTPPAPNQAVTAPGVTVQGRQASAP